MRASTMGAVEGTNEHTIMANLCPSIGTDGAPAQAPSEAITALAANRPCKWRPLPVEDLAGIAELERETQLQIGATVYDLRQAAWKIRPDPQ